tara:strand:+ start:35 stop:490 length:456 start_codon:yes stop_codon:yes gene_type:complete
MNLLEKISKYYLLSSLFLFVACSQNEIFFNLKNLEWENRIIIVLSDKNNFVKQQIDDLRNYSEEIIDRDLVIIYSEGDDLIVSFDGFESKNKIDEASYLNIHKKYYDKDSRFLLIGKDGGIKIDKNEFIESKEIFKIIDDMPMRKIEMKNK